MANLVATIINSKIVFHEPITHDGIKLIPVAKIRYGFGGGNACKKTGDAGEGGGGGVVASPLGYIEIKEGQTNFKSIRQPISTTSLIFMGTIAGFLLLQHLSKSFKK